MAYDIYSKRQARIASARSDVYQYHTIPPQCRVQLVLLWQRSLGRGQDYTTSRQVYETICEALREEYGVYNLAGTGSYYFWELKTFFEETSRVDQCLDVIEMCMRAVINGDTDPEVIPAQKAVEILNLRLREASVGYQFENDSIVRVDSQIIHSEVVKPALLFLMSPGFEGANDEFMAAHRAYRSGDFKGCLVESLKAFESTMKTVCHVRKWQPEGDTASKLITTLLSNGLVPPYIQTQFTSLRSVLESGVPTIRNKAGAHGQGTTVQEVPEYLAAYALHQTAAAILFVMKAHEATT